MNHSNKKIITMTVFLIILLTFQHFREISPSTFTALLVINFAIIYRYQEIIKLLIILPLIGSYFFIQKNMVFANTVFLFFTILFIELLLIQLTNIFFFNLQESKAHNNS